MYSSWKIHQGAFWKMSWSWISSVLGLKVDQKTVIDDTQPGVCYVKEPITMYKKVICRKASGSTYGVATLEIPVGSTVVRPSGNIPVDPKLRTDQAIVRKVTSLRYHFKQTNNNDDCTDCDVLGLWYTNYKYSLDSVNRPTERLDTNIRHENASGLYGFLSEEDAIHKC